MNHKNPRFNDPRSRRAWRLFKLRTELMLSSLAHGVRKELLQDLCSHVQDAISENDGAADEFERVTAALNDIGDPKDFLEPLIADAVFRSNEGRLSLGPIIRTLTTYASRSVSYFLTTLQIVIAALAGAILSIASVTSVIRPGYAGVFRLDNGDIQIRLFGLVDSGEPILQVWSTLIAIIIGVSIVYWSFKKLQHIITAIIVESMKT